MIPLKRLYLVAGFNDADLERQIANLQRLYESGSIRFLARPYPAKAEKRADYIRSLVHTANDTIFASKGATNFCRKQDQPCAIDGAGRHRKTCERSKIGETACAKLRPQLVVVLCADHLFEEAFDRLGRGTLILRLPGTKLPPPDALRNHIDTFEPIAAGVVSVLSNRNKSLYAPLVPDHNFQRLGDHPIAREAQADPARLAAILAAYHAKLYRGDFVNPQKPKLRGAYMLDAETAFQADRLHTSVQIIGADSRKDGFHLLNAYHVYGVKTDPGLHFDVMNVKGNRIGRVLTDVLDGKQSGEAETHLNATPCDRLV